MQIFNTTTKFNYDNTGKIYISASVNKSFITPWMEILKKHLSPLDFFSYSLDQHQRDHDTYHMTIISPDELKNQCSKINHFIDYPLVISIVGIGKIEEPNNVTYFLVCDCQEAGKIREYLNLPKQDFHITLGFKEHDIFDKPKDRSSLIPPFKYIE